MVARPRTKELIAFPVLMFIVYSARYKIKEIVYNNIITYGYMKAKDIIVSYLNDLYLLKAKYRPNIEEILQLVPERERKNIETFIREEIRM